MGLLFSSARRDLPRLMLGSSLKGLTRSTILVEAMSAFGHGAEAAVEFGCAERMVKANRDRLW